MGGEKAATFRAVCGPKGSPPRGRGKACGRAAPRAQKGDHPRVGGEKTKLILLFRFRLGSPPRWRGKAEAFVRKIAAGGITPALAGKSSGCRYALTSEWDHPRVGGEKLSCPVHGHHHMGSPPRWRGKVCDIAVFTFFAGITPALAGKRVPPVYGLAAAGDHPRVGGEKSRGSSPPRSVPGSPPRWRGKATQVGLERTAALDHPRVGGEKQYRPRRLRRCLGSPPRWRGKAYIATSAAKH